MREREREREREIEERGRKDSLLGPLLGIELARYTSG